MAWREVNNAPPVASREEGRDQSNAALVQETAASSRVRAVEGLHELARELEGDRIESLRRREHQDASFTVVLATYERADALELVLRALAEQQGPDSRWSSPTTVGGRSRVVERWRDASTHPGVATERRFPEGSCPQPGSARRPRRLPRLPRCGLRAAPGFHACDPEGCYPGLVPLDQTDHARKELLGPRRS